MAALRIGLIDSGVASEQRERVVAARHFSLDPAGKVTTGAVTEDTADHGRRMAAIMLAGAPEIQLLNAQIFQRNAPTSPLVVAAALTWLIDSGVQVINMSWGLREDRAPLRQACAWASEHNVLLVAASPARGGPVFPAAYPGVVRVCGDARCGPGEWSILPDGPAPIGACPYPLQAELGQAGGSSFAAAHLTALLGAFLTAQPTVSKEEVFLYLEHQCRFYGRERRC